MPSYSTNLSNKTGNITTTNVALTASTTASIQNRFIAFDVETTGLDRYNDRIVELGAVLFVNGKIEHSFSSLVNPNIPIPSYVTAINHITNNMLLDAPSEEEIYPKFLEFLADATCGVTIMCAHNAKFDFGFLTQTLSRLGLDASFVYIDTLSTARKCIKGLDNYKQSTLESYFDLVNRASHRAVTDAENCGEILLRLAKLK